MPPAAPIPGRPGNRGQIVPGTHAYQCPFCGEVTRTEKELEDHLLWACRRVPSSLSRAKVPRALHPQWKSNDVVRCQRCGHVLKESQLAEHLREFHVTKMVAKHSVEARPSAAELLEHNREILRRRAEQLGVQGPTGLGEPEVNSPNLHSSPRRSVPCSCGGSNETCARCFGLGQIRDNRAQKEEIKYEYVPPKRKGRPRPILAVTPSGVKRDRTPNGPVQCLLCREIVRATVLGLHFSAQHSRPHNLLRSKTKVQWAVCPLCNINVKRLEKHMRSHDQIVVAKAPTANVLSERERLIKMGHIVPQKETTVAAPPIPKKQERKSKNTTAVTTGSAGALERWKDGLERSENPNAPKNLDYTRPYAHAYREMGKFGSHPSHDGFDDESTS